MTQKTIFLSKLAKLRQDGLINIKFAHDGNGVNGTEDDVYREINSMLDSEKIEETEEL